MELDVSRSRVVLLALVLYIVYKCISISLRRHPKVPGIGYGSLPIIGVWQGVFKFMKDPVATMAKGIERYRGGYFRVSTHTVEFLIVADRDKVAEYLAAPDDVLDFHETVNDFLQVEWTLGHGVSARPYHIGLVRTKLTQTIAGNIPSMLSEIQETIKDRVGYPEDWQAVQVYNTMLQVVARVSNNAFSGTEFCRNEEFLQNAIDYAQMVVVSAEIIRLVPTWFKPVVASLTPFKKMQRNARRLMGPYVQNRLDTNWDGKQKPKDMIQFLIDAAPDVERTMPQIVERMMTLNMASIHTTTMTVSSALCILAAKPEYIPELRAEVLENCIDGTLDKQSTQKLVKLDSFLRECGRIEPLGNVSSVRYAMKDFTFSDGLVVPKGTTLAAPIEYLHNTSPDIVDPQNFDGFRYSRMNEEMQGPTKHQMVNTDLNYVLFGHGKHACPGRFLAVTEMKLLFATVLLEYDLKAIPGEEPKHTFFGTARIPDTQVSIYMKAISPKKES